MTLAFSIIEQQPLPLRPGRRILYEVCEKHGLRPSDVVGSRKFAPLVRCRTEAAGRMAAETTMSLPRIGAILGKDHTTILMAIRRWNEVTGQNIRGLGFVPAATRERNRLAGLALKRKLSREERIRKSRLARGKNDFIRSEATRLFALGFDTTDIALKLSTTEPVIAKILIEARDGAERGQ